MDARQPSELKRAVAAAAVAYDQQVEQAYRDRVDDLAMRYGVDEETVEALWDEVAP